MPMRQNGALARLRTHRPPWCLRPAAIGAALRRLFQHLTFAHRRALALSIKLGERSCDAFSIWHPISLKKDLAALWESEVRTRDAHNKITNCVYLHCRKECKHCCTLREHWAVAFP